LLLIAAVAAVAVPAQPTLAVRGHLPSAGERVTVLVEDGRVVRIAEADAALSPKTRLIDLGPQTWLLPGFVLADSVSYASTKEPDLALTPDARAADAYDSFEPRPALLGSGVTALYLSPGRRRLVPGCGSVVRIGADPMEAVLEAQAALHVVVTREAYDPPGLFTPSVPPGPDNPNAPPERQFPRSRAGTLAALRQLVAEATASRDGSGPSSSGLPGTPSLDGFVEILGGQRPLRVRAELAADIRAVAELVDGTSIRLVIEGGTEAWRVAALLGKVGAGVILRAGTPRSGGLTSPDRCPYDRGRGHPDAARVLTDAGVQVALVPPRDGGAADLLWYAQDALPGEAGVAAITSTAARLTGVDAVAGTLATGRPADLCVFDRDPMAHPEARPSVVLAGGKVIHDLTAKDRPVAVSARRIHTASGGVIHDGTVLVDKGKIVAVGTDVVIPNGARRVTADTVIPGLIDAGGQVGIRSLKDGGSQGMQRGGTLPTLGIDKRPSQYFDPEFPDVRPLALSGVTSVAVTPTGGQPVSGVLSMVKTSGEAGDESLVKELAGVLLDYSKAKGSPDKLVASLKSKLDSGKKYRESWEKYEAALKKWKAENPDAARQAARERKVGKVSAPTVFDPLTGTWDGEMVGFDVDRKQVDLSLRLTDDKVTGSIEVDELLAKRSFEATFKDDAFKVEFELDGAKHVMTCSVDADRLGISWQEDGRWRGFSTLSRTSNTPTHEDSKDKKPDSKGGSEDAKPKDSEKKESASKKGKEAPKAPKKDPAKEPYRALLDTNIPVFVGVQDERIARALVKLLRDDFELTTVVMSPSVLPRLGEFLADKGCGFAPVGSPVLRVKGEQVVPVQEAVRRRIPVAMRSGWGGDGRTLYAAAAYAVRSGVRSSDALNAVTYWSALMLNVADRVGSLQAGLDADLVLLDGPLFKPGTRIDQVMIDGQFVEKERQ